MIPRDHEVISRLEELDGVLQRLAQAIPNEQGSIFGAADARDVDGMLRVTKAMLAYAYEERRANR